MKGLFNFRDVAHKCGIPSTNNNNWELGQLLVREAAKRGIEPDRLLTEKTDKNPTVNAPHCIAHYPVAWFDEACAIAATHWAHRQRQGTLL